jgi:ferric-dicitrate binding protein FerR (iron transport regulator)
MLSETARKTSPGLYNWPINMDHKRTLERLKQALQAHHQALEELESALLEFEESISGEASLRPKKKRRKKGSVVAGNCTLFRSCAKSLGWARPGSTGACAVGRSLA